MLSYSQSTGALRDAAGNLMATGYSGHGAGVNAPDLQNVPNVGPIPQGLWNIAPPRDTETHGPYVLPLTPHDDTDTFGRDGFLIHGDEVAHAGEQLASQGCIVLPHDAREAIWNSGVHVLKVTA